MPKRPRIGLDDLFTAARRGAGGLSIGKGRNVTDPTTEALITECEALRLRAKLADEQAEHYKREAVRLGELLKDAQDAQAELMETEAINGRMRDLLVGVALALKGPPPPLVLHDWSNLPLLAGQLRGERDHLQSEIERLMKDPDESN
jgi:hypothetical protein